MLGERKRQQAPAAQPQQQQTNVYSEPSASWSCASIASTLVEGKHDPPPSSSSNSNSNTSQQSTSSATRSGVRPYPYAYYPPYRMGGFPRAAPGTVTDPYEELQRVLDWERYRTWPMESDMHHSRFHRMVEETDFEAYNQLWRRIKAKIKRSTSRSSSEEENK